MTAITADTHGTNKCYLYGCRQPECLAAHAAYVKRRRRLIAYGRWQGFIPAIGVTRRLQALRRIGYSTYQLADQLGVHHRWVTGHCSGWQNEVTTAVHDHVDQLYRRLADTRGPSSRARDAATRAGFLGPEWWDEDTIDDPAADPVHLRDAQPDTEVVDRVLAGQPYDLNGRRLTITPADRYEVTRRLVLDGRGASAVARLLRCSGATAKDLVTQVCRDACLTEPAESEAS